MAESWYIVSKTRENVCGNCEPDLSANQMSRNILLCICHSGGSDLKE